MAATKAEKYAERLDTLDDYATPDDDGDGEARIDPEDADRIRAMVRAFDAEDAAHPLPNDLYDDGRKDGHKKRGTLAAWLNRLITISQHVRLSDGDAQAVNEYTTALIKDGKSAHTAVALESTVSKFFRFHGDLGVDPQDIVVHETDNGSPWTERDLLDADERRAMRTVAETPRERAVYHLLTYCGMRNTACRTITLGCLDLDNSQWYFNTSADGLKDIDRPDEPRPLFQAERAVREWLDQHPSWDSERDEPKHPDHYLVTSPPGHFDFDPTSPVTSETIRRILERLKERTQERDDVTTVRDREGMARSRCAPHMMRHGFVNLCRKHPDITDADIKFWLGHAPSSSVMEETYSHLTSSHHNDRGHRAFGTTRAASDDGPVEPWDTTCDGCHAVIGPGEDTCATCGVERAETPWDIPSADEAMLEGYQAAEDMDTVQKVQAVHKLVEDVSDDPEVRDAFLDAFAGASDDE